MPHSKRLILLGFTSLKMYKNGIYTRPCHRCLCSSFFSLRSNKFTHTAPLHEGIPLCILFQAHIQTFCRVVDVKRTADGFREGEIRKQVVFSFEHVRKLRFVFLRGGGQGYAKGKNIMIKKVSVQSLHNKRAYQLCKWDR